MDNKFLSFEEQNELVKRSLVYGDEKATVALINLCTPIAGRIAGEYQLSKTDFEDLMQEAMFGVLQAIPRYRPDKGTKFSTYCTFWMQKRIHAFAKSNFIRRPEKISSKLKSYFEFVEEFKVENGTDPSDEEIAKALDISEEDLRDLLNTPSSHLVLENVSNYFPSSDEDVADSAVIRVLLEEALEHVEHEKEEEKKAVVLYYGLYSIRPHTYKEIGRILDCSKEWARHLTISGVKRMQNYFKKIGFNIT